MTWNWLLRRRIRAHLKVARANQARLREWKAAVLRRTRLQSPEHKNKNVLGKSTGRETDKPALQTPEAKWRHGDPWETLT